jgi:hypothetical protein
MAIMATKRKSSMLIRITDGVQTPDGTLPPGIYQVVNGDLPDMLRDAAVSVNGPVPADVRVIDAAQFTRDLGRARRLSAPPAPPIEWTREELLRRKGWTEADLERAERLHFPKPTAKRVSASRDGRATLTWAYNARDIEQIERWAEDIAALARTVRI